MLMLVCFATPPPAAGSAPHAASRTSTPAVAAETGIMRAPPRTATLGHGDDEPAASLQVAIGIATRGEDSARFGHTPNRVQCQAHQLAAAAFLARTPAWRRPSPPCMETGVHFAPRLMPAAGNLPSVPVVPQAARPCGACACAALQLAVAHNGPHASTDAQ